MEQFCRGCARLMALCEMAAGLLHILPVNSQPPDGSGCSFARPAERPFPPFGRDGGHRAASKNEGPLAERSFVYLCILHIPAYFAYSCVFCAFCAFCAFCTSLRILRVRAYFACFCAFCADGSFPRRDAQPALIVLVDLNAVKSRLLQKRLQLRVLVDRHAVDLLRPLLVLWVVAAALVADQKDAA